METIKSEVEVGVEAADGTIFFYNGDAEKAKAECKKYEESAVGVVATRLKGVLIMSQDPKRIRNGKTKKDGTPEVENFTCYIDEDIARMFGYYEYKSFIFLPKTKEDIENFAMYCKLNGSGYIYNYDKLVPGKTYMVAMDSEGECTLCHSKESAVEYIKEMIEAQFNKIDAYLNPDDYIRRAYNKYEKVGK